MLEMSSFIILFLRFAHIEFRSSRQVKLLLIKWFLPGELLAVPEKRPLMLPW